MMQCNIWIYVFMIQVISAMFTEPTYLWVQSRGSVHVFNSTIKVSNHQLSLLKTQGNVFIKSLGDAGLCLPTYTEIQTRKYGSIRLLEEDHFENIRQTCENMNGTLTSPLDLRSDLPNNITLWTGSYVTGSSDWIVYYGCYPVSPHSNYLILQKYVLPSNSPEKCHKYCQNQTYFALQGDSCICLSGDPGSSHSLWFCTLPCHDSIHTCGGDTHASVYKALILGNNFMAVGEKCLSAKCTGWTYNNVVLQNECSGKLNYACQSTEQSSQGINSRTKHDWYESAEQCHHNNKTLITKISCRPSYYPRVETWIGVYKNKTTMDSEDQYFQPILSCSVLDVNTWKTRDIQNCNHEQHAFLCQVNYKPVSPVVDNKSDLTSDGKTGFVPTTYPSATNNTNDPTYHIKEWSSTENSFSTVMYKATSHVPTYGELSTNKVVTNARMTGSYVLYQISEENMTSTESGNHPYVTANSSWKFQHTSNEMTTESKMGLIVGITTAVVILAVSLAIAITIRYRIRNAAKSNQQHRKDLNVNVMNNDTRGIPMTSIKKEHYVVNEDEEYSYAITGDEVKIQSQQRPGVKLKQNMHSNEYSEYNQLNFASKQHTDSSNLYSTNKPSEEESYDSFNVCNRNVVLEDVYDHNRMTVDQDEYDHLHTKPAATLDNVYSHTNDMV